MLTRLKQKNQPRVKRAKRKKFFSAAPRLWRSWLSKYLSFLYPLLFMLNQLRDDDDEPRDCFREIYKFLNESFMWAFRRRQLWLKITSSQEWASILCKFSVQKGSISILYWDDFTIDFFIGQKNSSLVICREDRLPPVEDPSSSQGKKKHNDLNRQLLLFNHRNSSSSSGRIRRAPESKRSKGNWKHLLITSTEKKEEKRRTDTRTKRPKSLNCVQL